MSIYSTEPAVEHAKTARKGNLGRCTLVSLPSGYKTFRVCVDNKSVASYSLFDETQHADFGEAQPRAAAPQRSWKDTPSPVLAEIEQILGENSAPDADFLTDSWTVGVAAAAENFQRRQAASKRREPEMPIWNTFSFTPLFFTQVEPPVTAAWPPREINSGNNSPVDRPQIVDPIVNYRQRTVEIDTVRPLTHESACQALGVETTSTRQQIRAAYRKMASRHHPDRLAQGGAPEQKRASDRMAYLNDAYRILCAGFNEQ